MNVRSIVAFCTLAVAGSAFAVDVPIPLNYNFNGMVHPGEAEQPDSIDPSLFRSIADRGLIIDGSTSAPAAFGAVPIVGATGIPYTIETRAGVLDLVMLGNRNINRPFETEAPGPTADTGIAPDWLPNFDQRIPQTTELPSPIRLDAYAEIGLLYHITNVGTATSTFTVMLSFSDAPDLNITVTGRDWFGTRTVIAPGANSGLSVQATRGNFRGATNADRGATPADLNGNVLNVWEAVIDIHRVLLAGLGDYAGKHLTHITFLYPSPIPPGNRNYAIYAATVRVDEPGPINGDCENATPIAPGTTAGNNNRAPIDAPSGCGVNDTTAVWYRYDATADGMIEVRTCGSALDTTLAVYDGCGGSQVACSDNACGTGGRIVFDAEAGRSYRIRIAGNGAQNGNFVLTLLDPAPTYTPIALNYNFNGLVHGSAEQGVANRDNLDGYRAIADRGLLLLSGAANAIDRVPLVDADFMPFTLVAEPGVLDIVHLGDRNLVANRSRVYGSGGNNGPQPNWQPDSDQTGPQVTEFAQPRPVLTATSMLGVIYQITDSGGRFDTRLDFTDGSAVAVTMRAGDWFGNVSPPAPQPGSGLLIQRQLGVYAATQDTDVANTTTNNLNVAEAVVSVASLIAAGFPDISGKELASITFENPVSNANYPNSTPATGSGIAILAATLSNTMLGGPPCPADFNNDGGVDGADVEAFFVAWENGETIADVNNDGGIDGGDVETFFIAWEAGGCG
ncbi:MAG: hypothetical protein JNK25_15690 [Phycisphaerae bacterium]|nr:hypothetical protein [Phycisphaerae bacterium]